MKVDLHTHTTASDGALAPMALVAAAAEQGVELLSITDHDTLAAYDGLDAVTGLELVTGIELSSTWEGRTIHIVGLNVDPTADSISAAVKRQQAARHKRAEQIAERLASRHALDVCVGQVIARADGGSIGRPHFAAELVAMGAVRDIRTAFRKYLGAGKAGDVKAEWPDLSRAISWIRDAGGSPVLAHPAKYRMTRTRLACLVRDFKAAGGTGIEVVCGQQHRDVLGQMADLARDFELAVSVGSDFHAPAAWSRPGVELSLPCDLTPVWSQW